MPTLGTFKVTGFRAILQDQNSATQESYSWVSRSGSDASGPQADSAGLLHRFGPVNMPHIASGSSHAWILTLKLSTPAALPCVGHLSFGTELTAQAAWSADGMSCHTSTSALADQHPNAIDMTWQILGAATSATHPSSKRSWAQRLLVDTPTLQMSINGKKTIGGMFPAIGGLYASQVTNAEAGAASLLFLGVDSLATGFPLLPNTARLYLGFTKIKLLTITAVGANGTAEHPLAAVPAQTPKFTLWLQAAVIGSHENLTNAQATTLDH